LLSSFFLLLLLLDGNEALLAWRQKVMELPLMEDLAGGKRGVVPLYSRLEIAHQVAQVVALLHQCDIVHGALTLDQVVMVPSTSLYTSLHHDGLGSPPAA
jgi:tRNA A-37 threonylcarbamoyl transferase component Bud32